MFKKTAAPASTGYTIAKSLRFRSSASAYLSRTPASSGSTTTWTWSAWVKVGKPGVLIESNGSGSKDDGVAFIDATNQLTFAIYNNSYTGRLITTPVYRDYSAWYHIVAVWDTTNATSTDRMRLYVNGSRITDFSTASYPSLNANSTLNTNTAHGLGAWPTGSYGVDGYMAEVNFVDGQALTASSFGSFSGTGGVWQPKAYTGTYGTNGYYLKFTDTTSTTTLCYDYSGNSNNWTPNNISLTAGSTYDSMTDVPTLTSATTANYAVWNPLATSGNTFSNGNLTVDLGQFGWALATFDIGTSKWYCEVTVTSINQLCAIGLMDVNQDYIVNYFSDGDKQVDGGSKVAYGATWTTGDIIGMAADGSAKTIIFYKNGVSQGSLSWTGTTYPTTQFAVVARGAVAGTRTFNVNFGQRAFSYTQTSGYLALNSYNLSTPTITQGNLYMDATLYTGDGTNGRSITNAGSFKPDLVWIKSRSNALNNNLYDSNRGAPLELCSNNTAAESSGDLTAFNTNGFTINQTTGYEINHNGYTYVGWQWQAGQGTNASNTNGSVTTTVSVNQAAGFSIVKYTGNGSAGSTFGHGLGVAPAMMIFKKTSASGNNWDVYHQALGNTQYLLLDTTAAVATSAWLNNTSPTSTVFTLNNFGDTNTNGASYIAYCWAEISGFSKFGYYTGNASTDGPFVYTGFRPKYVLIKNTANSVSDWTILDTSRNTYNVANSELNADLNNAEYTANAVDFLSNGFKLRSTYGNTNGSGQTMVYACFAENPFKYALAR